MVETHGLFTVVTAPYFGGAVALAQAAKRHSPQLKAFCLVLGELDSTETKHFPGETFDFSDLAESDPDLWSLAFRYSGFEACCALKPYFANYLLANSKVDRLIYLDTDIVISSSFGPIFSELDRYDILLSPHLISSHLGPRDDWDQNELRIRIAGTFNMGFFAVKRSDGAERFLRWWQERTFFACHRAPNDGIFDDQRWVDLAPALFPTLGIFRHPGCNVAHWNLHERVLSEKAGKLYSNGEPLLFFHMSGWDPNNPKRLSGHSTRWHIEEGTPLEKILADYVKGLVRAKWQNFRRRKYDYDFFDVGLFIPPFIRKTYAVCAASNAKTFGNPFCTTTEHNFLRWMLNPGPDGISPLVLSMRNARGDVALAYSILESPQSREALTKWAVDHGCNELGLPPQYSKLIELYSRRPHITSRLENGQRTILANPGTNRPVLGFGVNLVGMLQSEKGGGVGARGSAECLKLAGIHTGFVNIQDVGSLNQEGEFLSGSQENPFSVNLFHLPPNETPKLHRFGRSFFKSRTNIAYWAWELEEFPDHLHEYLSLFDEIWVPSHFVQRSLARFSPVPVICVPHPIGVEKAHTNRKNSNEMTFGFSFDFDSFYLRKNPEAIVTSFQSAFKGNLDVKLKLKSMRADKYPRYRKSLKSAINNDSRIIWQDQVFSSLEMSEWWNEIDVYISLHRSEGFGLTLAEAMARAIPTIATAYSGNLDFMTPENSYLVRAGRCRVSESYGPYPLGAVWGDPDLNDAAEKMQWVYKNRTQAAEAGKKGQDAVRRDLSFHAIAKIYQQRLPQLRSARSAWL